MLTSCVQAYFLSLLAILLSLLLILPLVLVTKYDLKIDLAQGLAPYRLELFHMVHEDI